VFESAGPPRVINQQDLSKLDEFWRLMNDKVRSTLSSLLSVNHLWQRPTTSRARVVFLDTLNGPTLQMFGTRYNIEPFFFSSTIGGIPARFQSNVIAGKEDRVYLSSTFPPFTHPFNHRYHINPIIHSFNTQHRGRTTQRQLQRGVALQPTYVPLNRKETTTAQAKTQN